VATVIGLLGHSFGKLPNQGLVKEADATEFWAITPKTVKSEIGAFPAQAAA
jgi:hypothetical protein